MGTSRFLSRGELGGKAPVCEGMRGNASVDAVGGNRGWRAVRHRGGGELAPQQPARRRTGRFYALARDRARIGRGRLVRNRILAGGQIKTFPFGGEGF